MRDLEQDLNNQDKDERPSAWKADVGRRIRHSRTSYRALTTEERDQAVGSLRHDLYSQFLERASL